jgi:hypothetical protein
VDRELEKLVTELLQLSRRVVVLGPTPDLGRTPQKYLMQSRVTGKNINTLTPAEDHFLMQNKDLMKSLDGLSRDHPVRLIQVYEPLFRDGKIVLLDNGHLLYGDSHHLTYWGVMKLKSIIIKEL